MSATNKQTTDDQELDYKSQYNSKLSSLDAYKSDATAQLEQQKKASRQAAQLSYQKLLKYLPQQTAGYSVGMTETAKIAANNSLQRQLADADTQYRSSLTELNRYVDSEKDAAYEKLYQREQDQYQRERADEQWAYQKEQDAAAKQAAAYNELMDTMRNGNYNTVAELENYLFGDKESRENDDTGAPVFKGNFTDEQRRNLLHQYNTIKNDPEKQKADEEWNKTDAQKLYVSTGFGIFDGDENDLGEVDDWITITDEKDHNIWVDTTGKVSDEFAKRIVGAYKAQQNNDNASIKDGAVLYFDGEYYIYKDGSIYGVKNEDGLGKILDNERRGVSLYQGVD